MKNISMQTGEEFMVFFQDRINPRGFRHGVDNDRANRLGCSNYRNCHPGYEDANGISFLGRSDSDGHSDVSPIGLARGLVMDGTTAVYKDPTSRISNEDDRRCDNSLDGYFEPSSSSSSDHIQCYHRRQGSGALESPHSGKMKFLCSFGGKFLPRPGDGKLRYVGGDTRIISVRENVSMKELVDKTLVLCNQAHVIKYQLPGEELDALISVASDEDLQNMMEEFYELENTGSSHRLRIFLICINESETDSLDTSGLQRNSEYQYVAALNNVLDPSPRKSSSGNTLTGQIGCGTDSSPSFHRDSSYPQADNLDKNKGLNQNGLFINPPAHQFFMNSQSGLRSPPPYSPTPFHQMDIRHSGKTSFEDQLIAAQQPDVYNLSSPQTMLSSNLHRDFEQTIEPQVVAPHDNIHKMRDLANQSFVHNENGLRPSSYHRCPSLKERVFHSDKFHGEPDASSSISASNDSIAPSQRLPHAYSDSLLHDQSERDDPHISGLTASYFDHTISPYSGGSNERNLQPEAMVMYGTFSDLPNLHSELQQTNYANSLGESFSSPYQAEHCGENGSLPYQDGTSEFCSRSQDTMLRRCLSGETIMEINGIGCTALQGGMVHQNDLYVQPEDVTCRNPFLGAYIPPGSNHDAHISSQKIDNPKSHMPISTVMLDCHSDTLEHHIPADQLNKSKPVNSQQCYGNGVHDGFSQPLNDNFTSEYNNLMDVSTPLTIYETAKQIESPGAARTVYFVDEYPRADINPHNVEENKESRAAISIPLFVIDDIGPSLNLQSNDTPAWSVLHNSKMDEILKREISLFDQVTTINLEPISTKADKSLSGHEIMKRENLPSTPNKVISSVVIVNVEDVTDHVPSDIPISTTFVPHVIDDAVEDVGKVATLSQKEIFAEKFAAESDCERTRTDEEMDELINDATIAEIEAGIYGLQIIKNADLEELRELGTGTFGTVYHGKWRGTDVAIKRIKKSCFSVRSSEQERMIKDFWREAHILSKLHHPNVVAFYGVVPDGAEGTLATVTEFMVNGSLRNVFVRKDRALDRRKRLLLLMDAAFGMEYLHSKNIVHFDLKCDNLLVNLRDSQRPICKVGDFGLSRIKRNTMVSGGVRGTLPWMAPELLDGSSSKVCEKVDVFSFGVVMWEILTGEEPYANMHCGEIIGGIVHNNLRPAVPEKCDQEWRRLMEQCWSNDPVARPSFTEITDKLRAMSMAFQPKGQVPSNR